MPENVSIYEKLSAVQTELVCPKGQYNSFGKYRYRSCEDILAAVKPVAQKHGAAIIIGDELLLIGDRFYVRATARFIEVESGAEVTNTAYAREELDKKGMDGSQITGTASSYARKYALNGLLGIDDVKDADTDENHNERDGRAAKTVKKQDSADDLQHARDILLGLGRTKAGAENSPESLAAADKRTKDYAEKVYEGYAFDQLNVEQLQAVKVRLAKS